MSSTNKTANYELSQYIGSDKPTYLGDYNSDMLKIDTQMKANADEIVVAKTSAQTANTTAGTALSTAQTADQNAQSAGTTASTANSTANTALAKALENETNISSINSKLIYTTSEEVVGTYLDRPLYRRVINYTTSNDTTGYKNLIQIDNLKDLIIESFYYEVYISNLNITEKYVNNYPAFSFYYTTQDNYLKEKHTSSYANERSAQVIIKYTKTTDTPNT